MTILKLGKVREIFHNAGVKRVSPDVVAMLNIAISRMVAEIADDCNTVYPGRLLVVEDVVRVCEAHGGITLIIEDGDEEVVDLKRLVDECPLPDDLDEL